MHMFDKVNESIRPFLEMSGYEPKTTFFQDFSIADMFGADAVRDTFKRAFEEWKHDVVYLTELVMILNWKIWQHNETNEKLARVYDELWGQADEWCLDNLKDDDKAYFLRTTD